MRHKGNICDFAVIRNKELMRAFRHTIAECSFIDLRKACSVVANSPCSRFWVSEERATVLISAMLKGQYPLDSMRPLKKEMFVEIFKRVVAMQKEQPDIKISDAVFLVVNSPAPKFYMTPDSIVQIIWRIKKGHYRS